MTMNIWKFVVYPVGSCLAAALLINLTAIAIFGPNASMWAAWQNESITVLDMVAGSMGAISGVYFAVRAMEKSLQ